MGGGGGGKKGMCLGRGRVGVSRRWGFRSGLGSGPVGAQVEKSSEARGKIKAGTSEAVLSREQGKRIEAKRASPVRKKEIIED